MRNGRCWVIGGLLWVAVLVCTPSCGNKPPPGEDAISTLPVIDDDDYEHLPTVAVVTPTPETALPTPTQGPTPTTSPPSPTLLPLPDPNVSGTIYSGSTNPTGAGVRLAFYNSMQLTTSDTPKDPEDSVFFFLVFPPFPIEFAASVPVGDEYVAEAWQDVNENGTIDAGDLVGDSTRFYASDVMSEIEITLATVN